MDPVTGALVGISIYSSFKQFSLNKKAAEAQAAAAQAQAEAKRMQAKDLWKRNELNIGQMRREFSQFKGKQLTSAVSQGLSQESTLMALESTNQAMVDRVQFSRIEATSKYNALMMGADLDTQLSSDIVRTGKQQAFNTFLSSTAQTALAAS